MQKGFVPLIFLPFILLGLVFVYGVYWYTGTILRSPSSSQPTPQPTTVTSPSDETANWKIFISKNFNYSIKYPNDYQTYIYGDLPKDTPDLDDDKRYFELTGSSEKILLEIIPISNGNVRNITSSFFDLNDKESMNIGMSVDGFDAQVVENPRGYPKMGVVFSHGNYIYKFQTVSENLVTADVLKKMLKTFQFTGQRTGYKIYQNSKLNFTVEYPARWDINDRADDKSYYAGILFIPPINFDDCLTGINLSVSKNSFNSDYPDFKENFSISGLGAYRVSPMPGMNAPYEDVAFKKDGLYYVIHRYKDSNCDIHFNHFLSTFKFL